MFFILQLANYTPDCQIGLLKNKQDFSVMGKFIFSFNPVHPEDLGLKSKYARSVASVPALIFVRFIKTTHPTKSNQLQEADLCKHLCRDFEQHQD